MKVYAWLLGMFLMTLCLSSVYGLTLSEAGYKNTTEASWEVANPFVNTNDADWITFGQTVSNVNVDSFYMFHFPATPINITFTTVTFGATSKGYSEVDNCSSDAVFGSSIIVFYAYDTVTHTFDVLFSNVSQAVEGGTFTENVTVNITAEYVDSDNNVTILTNIVDSLGNSVVTCGGYDGYIQVYDMDMDYSVTSSPTAPTGNFVLNNPDPSSTIAFIMGFFTLLIIVSFLVFFFREDSKVYLYIGLISAGVLLLVFILFMLNIIS